MPEFEHVDVAAESFDMVEEVEEFVQVNEDIVDRSDTPTASWSPRNLLRHDTVTMTVLAQDPTVRDNSGPVLARIPVPADRLQRGPRNHRFHVVEIAVGTNKAQEPVALHADEDPWTFIDRWADVTERDAVELVGDQRFRAQNVFAVASHTLALFERHLGRPIPWQFGWPHLYLVPASKLQRNASYSRKHAAVLFGWLPTVNAREAIHTSLSFDVITHEVSHAILDGLRPNYIQPGLPDQLAFHEALADLVALFSVFDLDGVAEHLLDTARSGTIVFESDAAAGDHPEARRAGRAAFLKSSPLTGLAEQLGRQRGAASAAREVGSPALRRSVKLETGDWWKTDRRFDEPHRRAEVIVAAFMQTFVEMWAGRLEVFRSDGGMDVSRVAEEGTKSARHLLGMLLRALDYLPPVELEFPDVIDAVITADRRLAPDDEHDYRGALTQSFAKYGITAPPHRIVDEDGIAAPVPVGAVAPPAQRMAAYPPDPDAQTQLPGLRYEHLNLVALRSSPEEVYQFIWNNASLLGIDVRFSTRVDRVLSSTRVGPDGLIVNEVIADYTQLLHTTVANLPPGMTTPGGVDGDKTVELWGGGVLVFDQFGRFRLHQRKPLLDVERQDRRLAYLVERGLSDSQGGFGTNDGVRESERFAMLHHDSAEAGW